MIEIVINNEKILLEEVLCYVVNHRRPCFKCDLFKMINPNSPKDCERIAPSCIAAKRNDKTSIIYKIVRYEK